MIRANVTPAVRKLRQLAERLTRIAGREPAETTAKVVGGEVSEEVVSALGPHRRSGRSADEMLLQTSAAGVKLDAAYYLKFHGWWRFGKNGKAFPAEYVERAREVLAEQVRALLKG